MCAWISAITKSFLILPKDKGCVYMCVLSRVWLFDPMDHDPPGSSVHGVFQARILEWVAISFSRRFSQPRDWNHISVSPAWQMDFLLLAPPRTPQESVKGYINLKMTLGVRYKV